MIDAKEASPSAIWIHLRRFFLLQSVISSICRMSCPGSNHSHGISRRCAPDIHTTVTLRRKGPTLMVRSHLLKCCNSFFSGSSLRIQLRALVGPSAFSFDFLHGLSCLPDRRFHMRLGKNRGPHRSEQRLLSHWSSTRAMIC